jgi:hypothetical protein
MMLGLRVPATTEESPMAEKRQLQIHIPENLQAGTYSNQMLVRHTREEFVLDYMNVFPPHGIVTARVIVSPGHLKRMIGALRENLKKYEAKFGEVVEARQPEPGELMN